MSTTIIDALIVTLGLDSSGFSKGAKQVNADQKKVEDGSKKMGDAVGKSGKEMSEGLRQARNELLAFLGAVAGANSFKNFVVNTISANAALERTSKNLGMSAKDMAMWQLANEKAGGSVEGMTAQLKEAAEATAKFRMGQGISEGMIALQRYAGKSIGADVLQDANKYLLARADAVKRIRETKGEAEGALAAKQMGISDDTYNLIKQGASALELLRREQEKLAEQQAKNGPAAEKMRQQWNDLTHQFEEMAIKVMPKLIPVLEQFGKWLAEAIPKFEAFVSSVNSMLEPIGGLQTVIAALIGLKLASFTADVIGLASALGKLGVSAGVLGKLGLVGAAGAAGYAVGGSLNNIINWLTYKATSGKNVSFGDWLADKVHGDDASKPITREEIEARRAQMRNQSGGTKSNSALPRGMRNNNPGNIEYGKFAIAHGATGSDGRFAIFPTMEAGMAAQRALLSGYVSKGNDTISKIVSKYAPSNENNTAAYIAAVAKRTGIGANDKLTNEQIASVSEAMFRHENGSAWDGRGVLDAATRTMGAAASAAGPRTVNSTTDVKINTITINTQATDASGIAKDIRREIMNPGLAVNANSGVA